MLKKLKSFLYIFFLIIISLFGYGNNAVYAIDKTDNIENINKVRIEFEDERKVYEIGDFIEAKLILDFGEANVGAIDFKLKWNENLKLNDKVESAELGVVSEKVCDFNEIVVENSINFVCLGGPEEKLIFNNFELKNLEFEVIKDGEIEISIYDVSTANEGEGDSFNLSYVFNEGLSNEKTNLIDDKAEGNFKSFDLNSIWDSQYGSFRGSTLILIVFTILTIVLIFLGKFLLKLIKKKSVEKKKTVVITMFGIVLFSSLILVSFVFLNESDESLDERSDASEGSGGYFPHDYSWVKTISTQDISIGNAVIVDSNNNIYNAGYFRGADIDFNSAEGEEDIKSSNLGSNDMFLTKHDSEGNYVRTIVLGSKYQDSINSLAVDSSDNIYMTGYYSGELYFDGEGAQVRKPYKSGYDGFLTKYNSEGNHVWTRTINGKGFDEVNSVAVDSENNVYIVGKFEKDPHNTELIDFDDSENVDEKESYGASDIFLTKYNSDGSYGWTKTFGSTREDEAFAVAIDSDDNVYMAGYFFESVDFNYEEGEGNEDTKVSSGQNNSDVFLTKYNSDGSYGWTKTFKGEYEEKINSLAISSDNSILITGTFTWEVDFNGGPEEDKRYGNEDVFLTKYNSDGSYVWTKVFGGTGSDVGTSLAIDFDDNVYLGGYFDSGTVIHNIDMLLVKYSQDGSYVWSKTAGSINEDKINSIAIDSEYNLYTTGMFSEEVDFNDGEAIDSRISIAVAGDMFLTKYVLNTELFFGPDPTPDPDLDPDSDSELECTKDDDCINITGEPYCEISLNLCAECILDSHCNSGYKCSNNICVLSPAPDPDPDPTLPQEFPSSLSQGCTQNSDCIYKNAQNCCSCNNGGTEVAILKSKEAEYNSFIDGLECEEVACTTVYQCEYYEYVSPVCNTSTSTCTLNKCASFIDLNCSNTLTMSDYSIFVQDYLTFKRQGILNNRSNFAKSDPEKISISDYQKFVQEYLRIKRGQ